MEEIEEKTVSHGEERKFDTPVKINSSGSNGNVVASPIKKVVTESNTKKTPQSSQSKSIGKNEKKRSTPSKETATKKTPKSSQTAKKKKKIEEVEATISDLSKNIEKLRKSKFVLEKRIKEREEKEVQETKNKSAVITWPTPSFNFKIPQEYFSEALAAWQSIHLLKEKMHLPKLEADAFFDLIAFTGRNSVGIVEIFTALLRLLLKDKVSVYRIIQSVPKHLSIEHRANLFTDSDSTPSNKQSLFLDLSGYSTLCSPEVENKVVEDLLSWCHNDIHDSSFDSSYNGLAVLPRALSSDTITPTTWSAILRAIILRLEPVKQMRRQVTMRSSDIASKLKPLVKSSSASSVISAASTGNQGVNAIGAAQRLDNNMKFNRDAMLSLSSDPLQRLCALYEASHALENTELHALTAPHKLALLCTLIDACFGTAEVTKHMDENAEEMASRIAESNKNIRDAKLAQKTVSEARRQDAIAACKAANQAAAELKASKESKSPKKKSNSKSKATGAVEEPTIQQIQDMITELVMLSTFDVDGVKDLPELHVEQPAMKLDDDNDNDIYGDVVFVSSTRLKNLHKRDRSMELTRAWNDYESKLQSIEEAYTIIDNALKSGVEKDLRNAMKKGIRSGHRWVGKDGKTYCSPPLRDIYKAVNALDVAAKEESDAVMAEKAFIHFCIRVEPLGTDRHNSVYWRFSGCDDKLFVQTVDAKAIEHVKAASQTRCSNHLVTNLFNDHPGIKVLYNCRPTLKQYTWGCHETPTSLWALCESLDPTKYENEKLLKAAVVARFNVDEPSIPYQTTGSEFIGRRVTRVFGKKSVVGKIVGWWPAEGDDPALWHVQHTDGDEEDLEEHEVAECLVPIGLPRNDSASSQLDGKVSTGDIDTDGKTDKDRTTPRGDDMDIVEVIEAKDEEVEEEGEDDDDDEEDEPDIIKSFPQYRRNYPQVKDTSIGLPGLQQEILNAYKRLTDSLKRSKSDSARSIRKVWEENVKNAFSLSELKSALAELEEMVHQLQHEDDVIDEDEYRRNHEEKVAEMIEEGWKFECTATINGTDENALFDPNAPQDIIGRRGRRFFPGHGKSDGVMIAYLPADKNEGMALWHMEHDDGDAEDIDESDVEKAIRHHVSDAVEDDADSESDEDETGFEEESVDDDDMDVEKDTETKSKGHKNGFSSYLWPTVGVRRKWSKCLELSKTVGEVALSLIVFMRFATQFGVVDASSGSGLDMELVGTSRRGRTELSGLLKGQDMKYLIQGGSRNARKSSQKKSGRRQSSFY